MNMQKGSYTVREANANTCTECNHEIHEEKNCCVKDKHVHTGENAHEHNQSHMDTNKHACSHHNDAQHDIKHTLGLQQRFWISAVLGAVLLVLMVGMFTGTMSHTVVRWGTFIATTPIMLASGAPFMTSAWQSFKKHNANMDTLVALGTGVAYIYSLIALFMGLPVYFESAGFIIFFVLLGQIFEEKMRSNASHAVEKLLDLQTKSAHVLRDGTYIEIPREELKVGDIIRVLPGEKIAVDGVIVEGRTAIDESMVTGESMPTSKSVGDAVIGSTINTTGTIVFRAEKVGSNTMLAQIVDFVKQAQSSHAPIQNLTDKISHIFVPTVVILSILTFLTWFVVVGASPIDALVYAVSVLIIACPCALGLATPTALMVGTARSAAMGVLIKNGAALQETSKIDTVVFDKTGTLTIGKPIVSDIVGDAHEVLRLAASVERNSEHPLAGAITERAQQEGIELNEAYDFEALSGLGVRAHIDGHVVVLGNEKIHENHTFDVQLRKRMSEMNNDAKTVVIVGVDNKIVGLIAIQDAPKESAQSAIASLKKRGLRTVMLTGDNEKVAHAIAQKVGIDEVISDVLPQEKADVISTLRADGATVAFVGDGINDAPALSVADVGIAMGTGTDIAIEAGSVVLTHNDLRGVVRAYDMSKKTFNRIILNLFWASIYNVIGIPIAAGIFASVGFVLNPEISGLAMALSSVSVLASSLLLNVSKVE
ncbi:copper-translocating P-type ATPase [Alloscardovia theropitheci]|uniref:Copper-translocating P-type ATPase n=2 Tax=Alloscardovia theropitheci TaxID=2496842 RepID=A0A4R0QQ59_9BIFI|nr:copper-translocating P-type ATPase [Alloscardovia theropitheci]